MGSLFDQPEGIPRISGSAHVVGEEELETFENDDIHAVLSTVPGVYVRGEDGFGLRPNIGLRGANSDRSSKVTLMEDGILFGPAPYAAPAAYYFPLTTRLVGIEVFKGPAAIRFGPNTIGGAINLRTAEIPDETQGVVDLAAGRFGYAKAHGRVGGGWKGIGFVAEAARIGSSGFKELDNGGDTGFVKNDTMLKVGYRSPDSRRLRHVLELKGGFANERSNETYTGLTRDDFQATPYRRYAGTALGLMETWRTQAELTYVLADRRGLEFEVRAYRHDFDRAWRKLNRFAGGPDLVTIFRNPDSGQNAVFMAVLRGEEDSLVDDQTLLIGTNDRRYYSQGLSTAARWKASWIRVANELELGLRVHNDAIIRHHFEEGHLMTTGVLVPDGNPAVDTTRNKGSALAVAIHLHEQLTFLDRFTIAPGVRLEVIATEFENRLVGERRDRLDVIPVPGVGLNAVIFDEWSLFGGVHRGFSPVAPGQPDSVEPEFSTNYELGSRVQWRFLHAEAVGFFNDYDNLTGDCTFSSGCDDVMVGEQFSAGEVDVYGLESKADLVHRWNTGFGLRGGAQYTYTGSRFRSDFVSPLPQFSTVSEGDSLAYVPVHLLGGHLGAGGGRWDVDVRGAYTGDMRDQPGQGNIPEAERIPGFFVLDVAAEARVLDFLSLYGVVNNATASRYIASLRPFGVRPGAPLTFMIGVRGRLGAN